MSIRKNFALALACGSAAILAGCSGNNNADNAMMANDMTTMDSTDMGMDNGAMMGGAMDNGMAMDNSNAMADSSAMTADQQKRMDAMDKTSYSNDVQKYHDQDTKAMASSKSGSMSASDKKMADTANVKPSMRTFEQLDRNGDGKLSVAEFAIYAVDLDPNAKKPNDQTKPYATANQLNAAAKPFFKYDTNGDSYLQQDEFQKAKSMMQPGGAM